MTRDELIEAMAKAMHEAVWGPGQWDTLETEHREMRAMATAALAAIETAGAVVVPREATEEMCKAGMWALDKAKERAGLLQEDRAFKPMEKHAIRYTAMIEAAQEPK